MARDAALPSLPEAAIEELVLGPGLDAGVVGNSIMAALVDRQGRVTWCCYPHLDGDPVFCGLLDGSSYAGNWMTG